MARLTAADKARNEAAIRAAMERLLSGDLPPGGKADIKALAAEAGVTRTGFYPKKNRDGTVRPGPYQHLAEEFERRIAALHEAGVIPDPRVAQIERLKTTVAALDLLLLVLIEAVIIVTAPAIGVMLAMALIVGPAATARLWTDRIGLTVLLSVALGTGSCALGLALSTHWDLASSGTITLVVAVVFLISLALSPHGGLFGLPLRRRAVPTG